MQFEWQKLKAAKGNVFLLLAMILFCMFSIISFSLTVNKNEEALNKSLQVEITEQEQLINEGNLSDESLVQVEEQIYWLGQSLTGLNTKDKELVERSLYELEKNRFASEEIEMNRLSHALKVAELEFFQSSKIERIDDEFPEKRPLVQYLKTFFMSLSTGAVVLLIGFFFAFWLTEEYRNQTDVWFSTFPVKRIRQLLSKYSVTYLFIVFSSIIGLVMGGVIAALQFGMGHWRYPIFYLNYQTEISSMTSQTYLIKQCLSWLVIFFVLSSLALLLSALFRKTMVTLLGVGSMGIVLLMPGLLKMIPTKWIPYLITSYLDLPSLIIERNIWNNAQLTWEKGIIYLSLAGVSCLLLSFINYEKKSVLNLDRLKLRKANKKTRKIKPINRLSFEWKKMGGKGLFFSAFLMLFLFPIYLFQMDIEYSQQSRITSYAEEYEQHNQVLENVTQMGFPEEMISTIKDQAEWLKNRIDSLNNQDYSGVVQSEYEVEKMNLEMIQKGQLSSKTFSEQQLIVEELAFFKDSDIQMVENHHLYRITQPMIYFWTQLFNTLSPGSLVLLMLLFFTFFFTLEYRGSSNDWLQTFPFSPWIQLRDKIMTAFLFIVGSISVSMLISGVVTAVFHGVGTFRYPLFYLDSQSRVQSMLSGEFLIRQGFSLLLIVCFVLSLVLCLSLLFKNTFLTLIASFSVLIFGMIPGVFDKLTTGWAGYIPLRYLNLPELILANQLEITWMKGVISLGLSSLFLLPTALYLSKREIDRNKRWTK